jgi:hypothetical protein
VSVFMEASKASAYASAASVCRRDAEGVEAAAGRGVSDCREAGANDEPVPAANQIYYAGAGGRINEDERRVPPGGGA